MENIMKKLSLLIISLVFLSGCEGLSPNFSLSNIFSFGSSKEETTDKEEMYAENEDSNTNSDTQINDKQYTQNNANSSIVSASVESSQSAIYTPENQSQKPRLASLESPTHSSDRDADGVCNHTKFELTAEEVVIFDQLKKFAAHHIVISNKNITPCRSKPKCENVLVNGKTEVHLTFIEFDDSRIDLQLIRSNGVHFPYIAKFTYKEMYFCAKGNTIEEAIQNGYVMSGSRNVTELPRYMKKKWVQ